LEICHNNKKTFLNRRDGIIYFLYIFVTPSTQTPCKYPLKKTPDHHLLCSTQKGKSYRKTARKKTETQPRNRSYQRLVRPAEDITQKARLKPKPKPQAEPPEKPTRDPFTFNLFSVAFRN